MTDLTALFTEHRTKLQGIIKNIFRKSRACTFDDIDDVLQVVFLRAHKRIEAGDEINEAWLTLACRDEAKSWRRNKQAEQSITPTSTDSFVTSEGTDDDSRNSLLIDTTEDSVDPRIYDLVEAVEELPAIYRQVLELTYGRGMKAHEAAFELGLPITTINKRLHSAKSMIRGRLLPQKIKAA